MRSTISSRGQTAVPAAIRRRFNLADRSRLEWMVEGDVITVLPIPTDPVKAFRGVSKGKYTGAMLLADRKRERTHERRRG
jgi:bifunctional DNA-binding transcriptional regulator/antitoxin component of YhaV-PrlF toxin-antitoxin module